MTNREAYKNAFRGCQYERGDLCGFIQRNLLRTYGLCCPDVGCDECSKFFQSWLDSEYEGPESEIERARMVVIKTEFVELPEYCEACCYFGSRPHPRDGWIYANYAARESTLTGVKMTAGVTTETKDPIIAH